MISRKTKYALKALKVLARRYKKEPTFVWEIVNQENIPRHYLEAILVQLKHSGLIESRAGKGGGYSLLLPADQISFLFVLEAIEKPLTSISCVASSFTELCADCQHTEICTLQKALKTWQAASHSVLSKTTIQDLL